MRHLCCALAMAATLVSGSARADVLSPPPKDCPPGTIASGCHGPGLCMPLVCLSDANCGPGTVCLSTQLCVKKVNCGGGYSPKYVDSARQSCAGGAACKSGTCTKLKVCLPGKPKPDAQPAVPDAAKPSPDVQQPAVDVALPGADSQQPGDSAAAGDSGGAPGRGCSCDAASTAAEPLLGCAMLLLLGLRRRST